jgi:hypothetical protein
VPEELFVSSLTLLFFPHFFINLIDLFKQLEDFLVLVFLLIADPVIFLRFIIGEGYNLNPDVLTALVKVLLREPLPSQIGAECLVLFIV